MSTYPNFSSKNLLYFVCFHIFNCNNGEKKTQTCDRPDTKIQLKSIENIILVRCHVGQVIRAKISHISQEAETVSRRAKRISCGVDHIWAASSVIQPARANLSIYSYGGSSINLSKITLIFGGIIWGCSPVKKNGQNDWILILVFIVIVIVIVILIPILSLFLILILILIAILIIYLTLNFLLFLLLLLLIAMGFSNYRLFLTSSLGEASNKKKKRGTLTL